MKKYLLILTAVLFTVMNSGMVYAIPALQLDIVDGVYRSSDQTTISTSNVFTLSALLKETSSTPLSDMYYISAAVTPQFGPDGADLGSFVFNGQTINVTSDMLYGTPPIELLASMQAHDGGDLGQHDIFDTYFFELAFYFNQSSTVAAYDVQTDTPGPGLLYLVNLEVDTRNLGAGYQIHFDLYNEALKNIKQSDLIDVDVDKFAPFSHDAESGSPVPEPATLLLLGSGLLGMAGFRKKNSK